MGKSSFPKKLIWMDLEMTGLEPKKDRVIEVAAIVSDFDFNELATYEAVIRQPDSVMEEMNEWAAAAHGANGLTARVKSEGRPEEEVTKELTKLIKKHFDQPAVLAGNSVHQDRRFIRKWWPEVDALMHYRMLDVSSFKVFMQGRYQMGFNKPENHRALGDIRGSIEELQYYIKKLPKVLQKVESAHDD